MSYRQSSYDPLATSAGGRPLRPFNRVQWTGVALIVLSLLLVAAMLAGEFGLTSFRSLRHAPVFIPALIGSLLVNSRREPVVDPAPELAAARRKWLLITVAVCGVILGAAAVLSLKGA
ncbi:hypothetical protein OMW55_00465 [Sphingomonas sp. BN140010]|uniref:Uncharacterized protein n=1 Tax=Sphingomonas arvum TaxID=2992113 RepID=A0ABT3JB46_9SPHN|nr:hypothetical protein [Sphingomonas sp. BN140010]MCW3796283.1 hypothetical protein [Sphingomonas sp. BN140010]